LSCRASQGGRRLSRGPDMGDQPNPFQSIGVAVGSFFGGLNFGFQQPPVQTVEVRPIPVAVVTSSGTLASPGNGCNSSPERVAAAVVDAAAALPPAPTPPPPPPPEVAAPPPAVPKEPPLPAPLPNDCSWVDDIHIEDDNYELDPLHTARLIHEQESYTYGTGAASSSSTARVSWAAVGNVARLSTAPTSYEPPAPEEPSIAVVRLQGAITKIMQMGRENTLRLNSRATSKEKHDAVRRLAVDNVMQRKQRETGAGPPPTHHDKPVAHGKAKHGGGRSPRNPFSMAAMRRSRQSKAARRESLNSMLKRGESDAAEIVERAERATTERRGDDATTAPSSRRRLARRASVAPRWVG